MYHVFVLALWVDLRDPNFELRNLGFVGDKPSESLLLQDIAH